MLKRVVALGALIVSLAALAACGGGSGQWGAIGPSSGEQILSLVADPHNAQLLYAGGSDGHIYRVIASTAAPALSAGAGVNAHALANAILPDTTTPGLVYAATSYGVLASSDYGQHWATRSTNLPAKDFIEALAFGAHNTLFAGTEAHGVYISQDSGKTWQSASSGLPANADVYTLFSEPSAQTLFAGLVGHALYASHDGGQSWQASAQGMPNNTDVFMLAKLSASNSSSSAHSTPSASTLFAATAAGLFASTDGGQTWTATPAKSGLPAGRVLALATDASAPAALYAGTDQTVYVSKDSGGHWAVVAPGLATHIPAIVVQAKQGTTPVIFAAAGPLIRDPAPASGFTWTTLFMLAILGGLLYFVFGRRRRILQHYTQTRRDTYQRMRDLAADARASKRPDDN